MRVSIGTKIGAGFTVMLLLVVILGMTCFVLLKEAKVSILEIQNASQRESLITDAALAYKSHIASV